MQRSFFVEPFALLIRTKVLIFVYLYISSRKKNWQVKKVCLKQQKFTDGSFASAAKFEDDLYELRLKQRNTR